MPLRSASFEKIARLQSAAKNNPPLRAGESGVAVSLLQFALAVLGHPMPKTMVAIVPDGIFGSETSVAVTAFQRSQRLVADGVVGKETLGKLDDIFFSRSPLPLPPFPRPPLSASPYGDQRGQDKPLKGLQPVVGPGANLRLGFALNGQIVGAPGKAAIISPPSPDWVEIGRSSWYKVGTNGPDNDLGFNDVTPAFGNPSFWMEDTYRVASLLPDSILESGWRTSFASIHQTGQLGQQMIDRFMAGSGGKWPHFNNSDLSSTASNTLTFANARLLVRAEIKRQLKAQLDAGAVDWRKLSVAVDIPFSTATLDTTVPLRFRAMIGGIHGTKLFARNFRIIGNESFDPVWSATYDLKYEMGDHFGVGRDDMYTPDLVAMNILQHERSGHRPFLNYIEVEDGGVTNLID